MRVTGGRGARDREWLGGQMRPKCHRAVKGLVVFGWDMVVFVYIGASLHVMAEPITQASHGPRGDLNQDTRAKGVLVRVSRASGQH